MSQKGKFINAFQSIQMLGGYEGENNIEENKNISEENKNNIEGNKNNDAPEIPLETGEELYNPLEGLDEESNDAQNMVISQSPILPENTSIDKIIEEKPEQTNVIGNNNKTINSPIFNDPSIDTSREVSDITSQEDNLVIDINDTTVVSNISLTETLLSDEKTLTTKEKKDFVDDTDELLGTALAELEEEEREEKGKLNQNKKKKKVKTNLKVHQAHLKIKNPLVATLKTAKMIINMTINTVQKAGIEKIGNIVLKASVVAHLKNIKIISQVKISILENVVQEIGILQNVITKNQDTENRKVNLKLMNLASCHKKAFLFKMKNPHPLLKARQLNHLVLNYPKKNFIKYKSKLFRANL